MRQLFLKRKLVFVANYRPELEQNQKIDRKL